LRHPYWAWPPRAPPPPALSWAEGNLDFALGATRFFVASLLRMTDLLNFELRCDCPGGESRAIASKRNFASGCHSERPKGAKPALSWAEGNLDFALGATRFFVAPLLRMTGSPNFEFRCNRPGGERLFLCQEVLKKDPERPLDAVPAKSPGCCLQF
jgi:hypothetical protein